jgi:drug/metabolite transporter (DMT)-like permease
MPEEGSLGVPGAGSEVFLPGAPIPYRRHVFVPVVPEYYLADAPRDHDHVTTGIFWVCTIMYGSIIATWLLYLKLVPARKDNCLLRIGMVCASWASCSIGMVVLNKQLARTLQAPALIATAQMALGFGVLAAVWGRELLAANRRQMACWTLVSLSFAGLLCSSMYTMQHISMSLFTVIRNLMPLITLPLEAVTMPVDKQPRIDVWIVISLLVTLVGAVLYADGLQDVSKFGILCAFLNMAMVVGDKILQRRLLTQECKDLHAVVCTMVSNLFGMLPCIALAFATGQISELPEHKTNWTDPRVITMLCFSGVIGIGIGALSVEVQRHLTATSFMILHNFPEIAVILIGVVVFGDAVGSPVACSGLLVSLLGGFMYSRLQMRRSDEEKPLVGERGADARAQRV